jgi:ubiquitin fusion degradation protein 1
METLICFSFTCSASPDEIQKLLKYSNKILLPPSILHKINERDDVEFPLFFKVINPICDYGRVCAVHEFTSTEGLIIMPYYIMEELGIQEGSEVNIDYVNPPKGSYLKIRPHQTAFTKLNDPKTVLEHIMSKDYPVITQGETIVIDYKDIGKRFRIDIVETKPAEIIKIIDTDLNLDFDTPLDYVEPPKIEPPKVNNFVRENKSSSRNTKLAGFKKTTGFVPFSGKGNVLGSK